MKTASIKTSVSDERVDAKVTFVMYLQSVIAIFRAVKSPEAHKWEKEQPWLAGPTGNTQWVQACYAHYGQHGACSRELLKCRRATEDEYRPLMEEMTAIGYNITPHQHGRLRLTEKHLTNKALLAEITALCNTANAAISDSPPGASAVIGAGFLANITKLLKDR